MNDADRSTADKSEDRMPIGVLRVLVWTALGIVIAPWIPFILGSQTTPADLAVFSIIGSLLGACACVGMILPAQRFTTRLYAGILLCIFLLPAALGIEAALSAQPFRRRTRRCIVNLKHIALGMESYVGDNGGYFPFDERGPLHSLSLLYPGYVPSPDIFQCPKVSSRQRRRGLGMRFPYDTTLAGVLCDYGYTWRCGVPYPAADFVILADMPENHQTKGELGFNVLYADRTVRWQKTPFCSHDPNDNIFAREPGWSADTDSWIRQE